MVDLMALETLVSLLKSEGIEVQTKRICLGSFDSEVDEIYLHKKGVLLSHGGLTFDQYLQAKDSFLQSNNRSIFLNLTNEIISIRHIDVLFEIMQIRPANTFCFTYGFNLPHSTPYFPSAGYRCDGFSVGLQPTNLADGCNSLDQWFSRMKEAWIKLDALLGKEPGYLGIDSSIAPLGSGPGSFVNFIRKQCGEFDSSVLSPVYTKITSFIKTENPRPVGLCGMMLPCLEDYELAEEYEKGNFAIERNLFLSLHSGVGIDTYPIAINQDRNRVLNILQLVQNLSNKYNKPLSIRFVSDGKARVGESTDFKNGYLKDVVMRAF